MIRQVDDAMRRWAVWQLAPIPGHSLGYGTNILARVIEGQGTILPGAPRCSGPVKIHTDPVANVVEEFLRQCGKHDRRIVRVYYLRVDMTVQERAGELKIPLRTLYRRLDAIHRKYIDMVA